MDVVYTVSAIKGLKAMPKADAERLRGALQQVADTHPTRQAFVTEMVGAPSYWRCRKGMWRAVYRIKGNTLEVIQIASRGDIYR